MIARLVLSALFLAAAPPEPAKVYYGVLRGAKSPAVETASKVFNRIPEFKKIKEKGLTSDNPEYFILLNKANAKFYDAVSTAASAAGYDVVVEKGSHDFPGKAVDLTEKVIKSLE